MEAASFWSDAEVHVAVPPGGAAVGLREAVEGAGQGGCCLFQTSGSEGRPKWVQLSKEAILVSAKAVCDHLKVSERDRWLLALPLWHVGGASIWCRAAVSGSAVDVLPGKWSARDFADACEAHGSTLASLVPTQVVDLVRLGVRGPPTLRYVLVGGAALNEEVAVKARKLGWPVLQTYGMTEAASQVATEPIEALWEAGGLKDMLVLPHWKVSLVDGYLSLEGPALADGYWTEKGGVWTRERIGPLFITRDRVKIEEWAGRYFLRFLGREKGMLKVLGELTSLAALQSTLDAVALEYAPDAGPLVLHPLPDERAGHVFQIIHQRGMCQETALDAVRAEYDRRVRPFERITSIRVVDGPVLNEMGKVLALANEVARADECP
jgi:o-succinylbenzoate---CoA ligase